MDVQQVLLTTGDLDISELLSLATSAAQNRHFRNDSTMPI